MISGTAQLIYMHTGDRRMSEGLRQGTSVEKKTRGDRVVLGAPLGMWIGLIFVVAFVVVFMLETRQDFQIDSREDAITFFTVCAQVNATLAGFLLVGLLFLTSRRSFSLRQKRWFLTHIDIVALGIATFILVVYTFECLYFTLDVMTEEEIGQELIDQVGEVLTMSKLSYILILIGLLISLGSFMTRAGPAEDE